MDPSFGGIINPGLAATGGAESVYIHPPDHLLSGTIFNTCHVHRSKLGTEDAVEDGPDTVPALHILQFPAEKMRNGNK